ncbi:uncharacterized protein THITE_159398 [Thermothielavioides terrestris NRRL 8126]|uniref:Uncharacterized protein n=2 Tax=Thermothielavioides terrestris TaxID=2587410 RepID=G2RFN7_THETT|nr:uncharacterized protein THITE_159398 [Thermothielavioides terrestris NRRL 8126]AEO71641.1 hypothetical protein THITE_159398 [Thermothielavioides terrestris NRRL 8126]
MSSDFGGTASSSLAGEAPRSDANRMDNIIPPHLKGKGRAPHWLIPDTITESMIKSAEKASAMGSATTADAKQVKGIFFNAWGPNSEYARMMKTPTVVSDSASTRAETENLRPENLGKKGWARAPTRKQPPQLPDYLKYDIPFENHGDFEGDSDDNM